MKCLNTILRVLFMPIEIVLRLAMALTAFVLSLSTSMLSIVAAVFVLLGIIMFFIGEYRNGYAYFALAVLISPFGIPALAELLLKMFDGILRRVSHVLCT